MRNRILTLALLSAASLLASVAGRIVGTITDPSGAVIQKAEVTATNLATGVTKPP